MNRRFIILYIFLLVAALYVNLHAEIAVPTAKPFASFPTSFGEWRMNAEHFMDERTLEVLKPSDYLSRTYVNERTGKPITLYIGYHGGGKGTGEVHSPKHCLPGSGWFEVSTKPEVAAFGGDPLNLVCSVYRKGDSTEIFLYWFQVRDRTVSNEYLMKVAQIGNSFLHRRRDTAFIRISVPCGQRDEAAAVEEGKKFITAALPAIREYLPR